MISSPTQYKILYWLANGDTGDSSSTMAFWLGFDIKKQRGACHPLDPSDFDRCLRLLDHTPELRPLLPRMAELSPVWAAIIEDWAAIEACHLGEVGLGWTKARRAPMTYDLIQLAIQKGQSGIKKAGTQPLCAVG